MLRLALTLAASSMVASTALAQPGVQHPQPVGAASQVQAANNLSHSNGPPVKTGEPAARKVRKTNISGNPVGLPFLILDLGVSRTFGRRVAVSVSMTAIWTKFAQLSVTAPVYLQRTYSGPFIEPGVLIRGEPRGADCHGCTTYAGPQLLFGWHYTFNNGLNFAFALGVMKRVTDDAGGSDFRRIHETADDLEIEPNAYLRVGYVF